MRAKGVQAKRAMLKGLVELGSMDRARADALVEEDTPVVSAIVGGKNDDPNTLYIYDAIDDWGGFWGVSASEVSEALKGIEGDVTVRINSPGGVAMEGKAIHNALVEHDGKVTVVVDGLAASAASVIMLAGDEIVMNRGSAVMVHNAWNMAVGDYLEMEWAAKNLKKMARASAQMYAARAGGSVEQWLDWMADETWFWADEAIEVGIADRAEPLKGEGTDDMESAVRDWDLSGFKYAGREAAPTPVIHVDTISVVSTSDASPDTNDAGTAATAADVARVRLQAAQVANAKAQAEMAMAEASKQ